MKLKTKITGALLLLSLMLVSVPQLFGETTVKMKLSQYFLTKTHYKQKSLWDV